MTLPQRAFYTVQEAAFRWDCGLDDFTGWAATGKIEIVTTIEPILQHGHVLAGFVVIPVVDILGMFRRWSPGPAKRMIRRVKPTGQEDWMLIADPADHVTV